MKNNKLHKVKSTGFKTPDHYFESFEDRLFARLNDEEPSIGINETGFEVPKDYFDALDAKIMGKLNTDDKPIVKLNTRRTFYYVAGIAASLLLMFAIFMNRNGEEISAEMVTTYFENSDLDSYELAELLVDAELLEEDFTIIETEYNEDNLESYLLENLDIESILQQ